MAKVTQHAVHYEFSITRNNEQSSGEETEHGYKSTDVYDLVEKWANGEISTSHAFDVSYEVNLDDSCGMDCSSANDHDSKYVGTYNECVGKLDNPKEWKDVGAGFGTPSEFIGSGSQGAGTGSGDDHGTFQWTVFNKPDDLTNGATGVKGCVTLTIEETGQERKVTKELRTFKWGDKYEPPYKNVSRRKQVEQYQSDNTYCEMICGYSPTYTRIIWDSDEGKNYHASYNVQLLEYVFD